ncbi:DgyrCDS2517 [Dimorphilus gyrociliatus]|uniref:DgyrCDS2517 n=1 Tax=Dimorphilus gyrociliatus TaxID=2664684 RepID=A0A7I8VCB2_9ANNE|nr:DgyrCDS2517 [Dimorphilus gyrociliatus]
MTSGWINELKKSNSLACLMVSVLTPEEEVKTVRLAHTQNQADNRGKLRSPLHRKPSIGRIAGWAVSFDRLLEDVEGLNTFTKFLEKEYSDENIIFWKRCQEYNQLSDPNQRKLLAEEIFDNHLASGASLMVNIDCVAKKITEDGMKGEELSPNLFRSAQKQIYCLMKQDSYPRFLKSEMYRKSVVKDMEDRKLEKKDLETLKNRGESPASRKRTLLPWTKTRRSEFKLDKIEISDPRNPKPLSVPTTPVDGPGMALDNLEKNYFRLRIGQQTTVRETDKDVSLYKVVCNYCQRQGSDHQMSAFEAFEVGVDVPLNPNDPCRNFTSKEIKIEERVTFSIYLMDGRAYGVRGKMEKSIRDFLKPILPKFKLKLTDLLIHTINATPHQLIDHDKPLSVLNRKKVLLRTTQEFSDFKIPTCHDMEVEIVLKELRSGELDKAPEFDEFGVLILRETTIIRRISSKKHPERRNSIGGSNVDGEKNSFNKFSSSVRNVFTSKSRKSSKPPVAPPKKITADCSFFETLTTAQSNTYDDQRGPIKCDTMTIPDFLLHSTPLKKTGSETFLADTTNEFSTPITDGLPKFSCDSGISFDIRSFSRSISGNTGALTLEDLDNTLKD